MKLTKIQPNLDKTHRATFFEKDLLWKCIESIQMQVEEQHRSTIWKAVRVHPYSLSREVLDMHNIKLVVNPQHNQQWLEQKGQRIGPVVETILKLTV